MTTQAVFSHDVRVLVCGGCGAPLPVPPAGGNVVCSYCKAVSQVKHRDESADAAQEAPLADEAQRFERLRAHAQHPVAVPDSIKHLVSGGRLAPERLEDAVAEWKRTRAEMAAGGQFPVADRLFHTTVLLSDFLARSGEPLRQRALLETALELLPAPRHRQVLRGTLARHAAAAGDLAAADAWLAGCNPRSDDIHVDTAWRLSKAFVSTVRGDWQAVLQALGSRTGDVPIADGESEACALLRSHALERSGDPRFAVEQLLTALRSCPRGPAAFQRYLAANRQLRLCPTSFDQARRQFEDLVSARERPRIEGRSTIAGPVVGMVIASPFMFLGIWGMVEEYSKGKIGSAIGATALFAFMSLIMIGAIWVMKSNRREKERDLRILATGLDATLTVLEFKKGGKNQSDSLKVSVETVEHPAFETRLVVSIPQTDLARVAPGAFLRGRVDPEDRRTTLVFLEEA